MTDPGPVRNGAPCLLLAAAVFVAGCDPIAAYRIATDGPVAARATGGLPAHREVAKASALSVNASGKERTFHRLQERAGVSEWRGRNGLDFRPAAGS